MDELRREVALRGVEVESTKQELQNELIIKVRRYSSESVKKVGGRKRGKKRSRKRWGESNWIDRGKGHREGEGKGEGET